MSSSVISLNESPNCSCSLHFNYFDFLGLLSFPTRRASDLPAVFLLLDVIDVVVSKLRQNVEGPGRTIDHAEVDHEVVVVHAIEWKSTRLNSSHVRISYAVFCLKNKKSIYNNNFEINFRVIY